MYKYFIILSVVLASCTEGKFSEHENPDKMGGWQPADTLWHSENRYFLYYEAEDYALGPYRDPAYFLYKSGTAQFYKLSYNPSSHPFVNIKGDTMVLSNTSWNTSDRTVLVNLTKSKTDIISSDPEKWVYAYVDSSYVSGRKMISSHSKNIETVKEALSKTESKEYFKNEGGDSCVRFAVPAYQYDQRCIKVELNKVALE